MALTHGNEPGGLLVLNRLCAYLAHGLLKPAIRLGFLLGNVPAALAGRRFLEMDLNRSFGLSSNAALEERRAKEIEPWLRRARFVLDLHQTNEPTASPFFVLSYAAANVAFARSISPDLPIVTYAERSFSGADGKSSEEFARQHGAAGVGLELGQKGFGANSIGVGVDACLAAAAAVAPRRGAQPWEPLPASNRFFTWASVVPFPAGDVELDPGWTNFQPVESGQRLGECNGRPILAPQRGLMLFPKYADESASRPAELCRILRETTPNELDNPGFGS